MVRTLAGKRVLITSADRHMGPAFIEVFNEHGAEVIADRSDYTSSPTVVDEVVAAAGTVDILIAQFAGPTRLSPASELLTDITEFKDEDFQAFLNELVWPLARFARAVLPQMIERRAGKIVALTSGSALRPISGMNIYSTARGAQNSFIRSVGVEVAGSNVQVNAIAPNYHESNFYFTDQMLAQPGYRKSLEEQVPAGRLGTERECAELAVALSGKASHFLAGQVIPFAGGWVQ